VLLDPVIIVPPRDGRSTPPSQVHQALRFLYGQHPFDRVAMDRAAGGEQLSEWIETELGCKIVLYTSGTSERARCAQRFYEGLRGDPRPTLQHTGDPTLRQHVLNAVARVLPSGAVTFDRPSQSRSAPTQDAKVIDGLTAASIIHDAALSAPAPIDPSLYRIQLLA
jgi:hypothetical protein